MGKDPAFLFYPNDYLGGTMGMTFEEKGAYIELLMMQFNRGHMTKHMIGQAVGQLWDKIQVKFVLDGDGLYYNVRLEEEQMKRKNFVDSRINNRLGVNQYTKSSKKKSGHTSKHMNGHMEDRDVNVNKDIKETIEYLNLKTESNYKTSSKKTKGFIQARINEGFNVQDFKKVIDKKVSSWIEDSEMCKYLRPETLFGNKFEGYLNEKTVIKPKLESLDEIRERFRREDEQRSIQ